MCVECRDDAELDWFREQLDSVLFPDPLLPGDERCWPNFEAVPEDQAVFEAIRFVRDLPGEEFDDEVGFDHVIDTETRSICFEADASGNPDRLGFLLHRFLHEFRTAECLTFTWAATCDRLRPDAFDGGAMFVTANGCCAMSGADWAERQRRTFRRLGANRDHVTVSLPMFPIRLVLSDERGIDFDDATIEDETALAAFVANGVALDRSLMIRVIPPATAEPTT